MEELRVCKRRSGKFRRLANPQILHELSATLKLTSHREISVDGLPVIRPSLLSTATQIGGLPTTQNLPVGRAGTHEALIK